MSTQPLQPIRFGLYKSATTQPNQSASPLFRHYIYTLEPAAADMPLTNGSAEDAGHPGEYNILNYATPALPNFTAVIL